MRDAVHTEEYEGYTLNIYYDEFFEDDWDDELIYLVTTNNRYFNYDGPAGLKDPGDVDEYLQDKGEAWEVFALYAYVHGGVDFSLGEYSCSFDSGQAGYIIVKRGDDWVAREGEPDNYQAMYRAAEIKLAYTNEVIQGNVYGYEVLDPQGKEVESCWGFVGDYDDEHGVLTAAKESVDHFARGEAKYVEALLEGTGGAEQLGQHLDGLIQSTLFDEFSSHLQKSIEEKISWLKANGHDLATIEEDVLQQQPRGNE